MKEIRITIQGKVQGVSFRYYAQQQAQRLGVAGWVRNLPDGRVEVLAQGDEEQLQAFLKWCQTGPAHASVEKMDSVWQDPEAKYNDFEIKY